MIVEIGINSATETARRLVSAGAPDGPVTFTRGGQPILTGRLYAWAAVRVVEEPGTRFVPWRPHPLATPCPRLAVVIEQEAARRKTRARACAGTGENGSEAPGAPPHYPEAP